MAIKLQARWRTQLGLKEARSRAETRSYRRREYIDNCYRILRLRTAEDLQKTIQDNEWVLLMVWSTFEDGAALTDPATLQFSESAVDVGTKGTLFRWKEDLRFARINGNTLLPRRCGRCHCTGQTLRRKVSRDLVLCRTCWDDIYVHNNPNGKVTPADYFDAFPPVQGATLEADKAFKVEKFPVCQLR